MGVIDEQERWRLLRVGGEQAERRRTDGESIATGCIGAECESNLERRRARRRDVPEQVQRRTEQLVETGEWKLHLGFDASGAQESETGGFLLSIGEDRRLPNPGLADEREHRTSARADGGQQAVDRSTLSLAPEQHAPIVWRPRCGGQTLTNLLGDPPDATGSRARIASAATFKPTGGRRHDTNPSTRSPGPRQARSLRLSGGRRGR